VTVEQAREVVEQAMELSTGEEVEKFSQEQLYKILPKFYPKA